MSCKITWADNDWYPRDIWFEDLADAQRFMRVLERENEGNDEFWWEAYRTVKVSLDDFFDVGCEDDLTVTDNLTLPEHFFEELG